MENLQFTFCTCHMCLIAFNSYYITLSHHFVFNLTCVIFRFNRWWCCGMQLSELHSSSRYSQISVHEAIDIN